MQQRFNLGLGNELTEAVISGIKRCSKCKQFKPLSDFTKDKNSKDGYFHYCRNCKNAFSVKYATQNDVIPPSMEGTKICKKCGIEKSKTEFSKDKYKKSGLESLCKTCIQGISETWTIKRKKQIALYPPSMEGTKICKKCGIKKSKTEFSKATKGKDGLFWTCKECNKKEHKERRAKYAAEHQINPPSMEGMKICKKCQERLPKSEFYRVDWESDGFTQICKVCSSKIAMDRKAINVANREKNPLPIDSMKVCTKCGEEKPLSEFNKDDGTKDGRYNHCILCARQHSRKYHEECPHKRWADNTINTHRKKGMIVLVKPLELMEIAKASKTCPICGCTLDWCKKKGGVLVSNSPSWDRKHNERTMTLENTWIICHRCNTSKGSKSFAEYVEHCRLISERFQGDKLVSP